jgi:predicted phosphodiesterase
MSLAKRLTDLANSNNIKPWEPTQAVTLYKHPSGWEPGVVWNGTDGTGVTRPRVADTEADHASLLTEWGFDPKTHHIVGDVEYRQWDANVNGEVVPMRYYKARIAQGTSMPSADLEEIKADIRLWSNLNFRPEIPRDQDPEVTDAFCVFLSDFQIGKGEGGGSAKTIERLLDAGQSVVERVEELRRWGRRLDSLYVLGLGDLLEGCTGYYPMQEFQTDLNRRDQFQVTVRVILSLLRQWSALFERVVVSGIAGNHGENRRNGKAFTDFADNDDVAVFETAAMICNENPDVFGHVSFVIPHDRLSLTLDVAGINLGITHGHQMRAGGKLAQAKALEYWKTQTFGLQPIADSRILVSGHFHHFSVVEWGHRTHFQAPAMDGGSRWFTEISGQESPAGMLTFRVDKTGWSDLALMR